jgi:hypothetical protein
VFVLEKMAASVHDTEEATATAFKIILDEKVSQYLSPILFFNPLYMIVLNGYRNQMGPFTFSFLL